MEEKEREGEGRRNWSNSYESVMRLCGKKGRKSVEEKKEVD